MFEEIKRISNFLNWIEEKHPEILDEYLKSLN